MLFILTGNIQTGKTRWLTSLADNLAEAGVLCSGVIAPGVWLEKDDGGFEKLGIDNLLLPEGRLISFARRKDLALREGSYNAESASAKANLYWEIAEEAIAEVNAHFDRLAKGAGEDGAFGSAESPELLIVDEFGQLELRRNQGLTSALRMVESGTPDLPANKGIPKHCLIVVRKDLLPLARDRFGNAWGAIEEIYPSCEAAQEIASALGRTC